MLECVLFKMNEVELDTKIDEYKYAFNKKPTLECNYTTLNFWINYLVEKNRIDLMLMAEFMGFVEYYYNDIPLIINDDMEDGIIQIK